MGIRDSVLIDYVTVLLGRGGSIQEKWFLQALISKTAFIILMLFIKMCIRDRHIANRGVNINTVLYNFLGLVFAIIRVRKHWWDDIPKSSCLLYTSGNYTCK